MKLGLCLEGGGAKGAYHIGAIRALMDIICTQGMLITWRKCGQI